MRPKRPYYLLIILVLPLLILLQSQKITDPLHMITTTVLKPFLIVGDSAASAATNVRDFFSRLWKAFQNQGIYESRIAELESKVRQLDEQGKENDRLQKLLDFRKTLSGKTVAARVIGWDPSPWRKTVILDKGTQQGIRKDMAVVVPEGLAGRILEVGPETSRAILLIDPDARISAVADQSRAQGVVEGNGSAQLKMSYLELDGNTAVEENILTSGAGGLFPKGIRVGKITGLNRDASGLHLEATVQSYVHFSKLEEVLCLASTPGK